MSTNIEKKSINKSNKSSKTNRDKCDRRKGNIKTNRNKCKRGNNEINVKINKSGFNNGNNEKSNNIIISCFNDGKTNANELVPPVGFGWVSNLIAVDGLNKPISKQIQQPMRLTVLLHGACLKYGLRNSVYKKYFGTNNPFKDLLESWVKLSSNNHRQLRENKLRQDSPDGQNKSKYEISIKICNFCAKQDGFFISETHYSPGDNLSFVEPVPFSIQYLINQQMLYGAIVIYDSPLPF